MPDPTNNGKSSQAGDGLPPMADPLTEAEAIKDLLADAHARLSRLIAALKQYRKQSRAVRAAVESIRELPPLTP